MVKESNAENNNKVIPFPKDKLKKTATATVRLDLEQKKIMVSASLVSAIFITVVVNAIMFQRQSDRPLRMISKVENSRAIASVSGPIADQFLVGQRDLASYGRKPRDIEQLIFGELAGKYRVQYENDKVSQINWSESGARQNEKPTLLKDRIEFLEKHRGIWPVSFEDVKLLGTKTVSVDRVSEEYALYSKAEAPVAHVKFLVDQKGQLYSMIVEANKE